MCDISRSVAIFWKWIMSIPVRFSALKNMALSPAHYRWYADHPIKQTKPMLYGDALDSLLFGTKEVLTFDGASRRTKAWTIFADENPEAVLLLAPEREQVDGMLASLQANSEAMDWLRGTVQTKIEWEMNGRKCSGTPDAFTRNRVAELKSTRSANPDRFQNDGRHRAYHAQLAWYHNGLHELGLVDKNADCAIVAVESSPPYPVTIFKLTGRAYDEGTKLWRLWFERLLVCEQSEKWPAYCESIVPFETPDTEGLTLKIDGEEMEIE